MKNSRTRSVQLEWKICYLHFLGFISLSSYILSPTLSLSLYVLSSPSISLSISYCLCVSRTIFCCLLVSLFLFPSVRGARCGLTRTFCSRSRSVGKVDDEPALIALLPPQPPPPPPPAPPEDTIGLTAYGSAPSLMTFGALVRRGSPYWQDERRKGRGWDADLCLRSGGEEGEAGRRGNNRGVSL